MLGHLSADKTCSDKRTAFRERSSRKTVSFEEQIMSKDKYARIFSCQIGRLLCLLSFKYFPQHTRFWKLGNILGYSPVLAGNIRSRVTFRPIARELKYLMDYNGPYYSTNCNTIQIWSWCSRYLSSVGNRYPAIYVTSYVGRKSDVKKWDRKSVV